MATSESIGNFNNTMVNTTANEFNVTVDDTEPNVDNFSNATTTTLNAPDEAAKRQMYMMTYAVIMVIGTIVYLYRSFAFFKLCLRVSINLHDKLFRGITRAKMLFYNTNPSGRILNRFARDINNVDSILPMVLIDCTDVSGHFKCIFIINLLSTM